MKYLQILRAAAKKLGGYNFETSVKRAHAPGYIVRLRLVRNSFSHRGGMFGYDSSITVSYACELISVSMCYSQGDGFNTSLSRLCTVPTGYFLPCLTYCLACVYGVWYIVLGVVAGGTVMCYLGRR